MTFWNKTTQWLAAGLLWMSAVTGASAAPTVSFMASPNPGVVGSPLSVDVLITDVTDLSAFGFSVNFDHTVLQLTGSLSEGPFLSSDGGATIFDGGNNSVEGQISSVFGLLLGPSGVTGDGVLGHVNFTVLQAGSSQLSLSDVMFFDSILDEIQVTTSPLTVQTVTAASVPEPGSLVLIGLGFAGFAAVQRRRRTRQ